MLQTSKYSVRIGNRDPKSREISVLPSSFNSWRELLGEIAMRKCKIEDCSSKYFALGYCNKHYQQVKAHGYIKERNIQTPNEFIIEGDICRIKLYNMKCKEVGEAIIDAEDYEKCKGLKWHQDCNGYVVYDSLQDGKIVRTFLHHLILGKKAKIDHKDGTGLNNKKDNLRFCTRVENAQNRKLNLNNKSGYKGVCWGKEKGMWMAYITYNCKRKFLGYFDDVVEAAEHYNAACLKYHKDFARLNGVA